MNDQPGIGVRALAPAFALGALGPEEEAGFRVALSRSVELQDEVSRFAEVAARLGIASGKLHPPPELKARLMARVRNGTSTHQAVDPPLYGERGHNQDIQFDALDWTKSDIGSGIEVYWLSRNDESGEMAAVLRGAPGATYPDHIHPGGEHFFVLHGSFADHRHRYEAGDSGSFAPGSVHRDIRVTGTGPCILLVIVGPGGLQLLEASSGA